MRKQWPRQHAIRREMLPLFWKWERMTPRCLKHESHSGNARKGLLQFPSSLGPTPREAQPQAPGYAGATQLESSLAENWGS